MSGDLLRRAAKEMRERAGTLPTGPWGTLHNSDDQSFVHDSERLLDVEVYVSNGDSTDFEGTRRAAEHIASWHPAVALTVADWLDRVATALETNDPEEVLGFGEPSDARAVARAYLGEAS